MQEFWSLCEKGVSMLLWWGYKLRAGWSSGNDCKFCIIRFVEQKIADVLIVRNLLVVLVLSLFCQLVGCPDW